MVGAYFLCLIGGLDCPLGGLNALLSAEEKRGGDTRCCRVDVSRGTLRRCWLGLACVGSALPALVRCVALHRTAGTGSWTPQGPGRRSKPLSKPRYSVPPVQRKIDQELKCPTDAGHLLEEEIRTVISIVRTGDGVEHRVARLLREHRLTRSQYNVMRVLRDLGREMTVVELADFMIHETPAMTGVIDRLEKEGFVERKRSVEDRRLVYVKLCRKGAAIIRKLDKPILDLHAQLVSKLSASEQSELRRMLAVVRDAFPPLID